MRTTGRGGFVPRRCEGDTEGMRHGFALNSKIVGAAGCVLGVRLPGGGVFWIARPPRPAAVEQNAGSTSLANATPAEQARMKFVQSCSNCHGPEGRGLPRTGPDLTASRFVATKSDA